MITPDHPNYDIEVKKCEGVDLITRKDFEEMVRQVSETTGWEKLYEEGHIRMWRRTDGQGTASGLKRHKYSGRIPFSADVFFETCTDHERQTQWDSRHGKTIPIIELKPRNSTDPSNLISWYYKKAPWPVTDRDFVTCYATIQDSVNGFKRYMTMCRSTQHPDYPENPSKYVRADISYFGFIVEETEKPDECIYSVITEVDFRGWIPASVMNWVVTKVPAEFEKNAIAGCQLTIEARKESSSSSPMKLISK